MTTAERTLTRRGPKQQRSRQTVDDVLEAVELVVKRHGTQAITTNRIAEAAGVRPVSRSIGLCSPALAAADFRSDRNAREDEDLTTI